MFLIETYIEIYNEKKNTKKDDVLEFSDLGSQTDVDIPDFDVPDISNDDIPF